MSLLKHIEENAEHLLDLVKHMMQIQLNMQGVISEETKKLHEVLDAHVNPQSDEPAVVSDSVVSAVVDTPAPAPVSFSAVVEETVVVEAPQTIAQAQSASNIAN